MSVSEVLPQDGWFLPALSQEVGEEWQGVVKLHLFVVEGADEEEGGEAVQSMQGSGHGPNHQAEGDVVVLEGGPRGMATGKCL